MPSTAPCPHCGTTLKPQVISINCDKCGTNCNPGMGGDKGYGCRNCNYDLCPSCWAANINNKISRSTRMKRKESSGMVGGGAESLSCGKRSSPKPKKGSFATQLMAARTKAVVVPRKLPALLAVLDACSDDDVKTSTSTAEQPLMMLRKFCVC